MNVLYKKCGLVDRRFSNGIFGSRITHYLTIQWMTQ